MKKIVNELYNQTIAKRQALVMSRRSAEQIPTLPSIGVIPITAAERGPANLASFPTLLRLSFADVDFLKLDLSIREKYKLDSAFNQQHA
ncbi:MAG: hypothetical protein AB7U71_13350 [Comamonas sp.]